VKNFYWLIQGDCLKILPKLKSESVDLILTDPPYNIASSNKLTKRNDKIVTTMEAWGKEINDVFCENEYREIWNNLTSLYNIVLKQNGSILTFFDRNKPYYLEPMYRKFVFRNMIAFVYKNPLPHFRKNNYRSGFELCAWFSKEQYKINFLGQKQMINVFEGSKGITLKNEWRNPKKVTSHPTEKYEWQIKPLIERHSDVGDVVLDPFLGSGTTMKVCQDLGRSCIGIEINPKYCEIVKKRCFGRQFLDREVEYKFEVLESSE